MKKIITSLFVFGLIVSMNGIANAKIAVDVAEESAVLEEVTIPMAQEDEISVQVEVGVVAETTTESQEVEQNEEDISIKPEGTRPPFLSEWVNVGNPGFSASNANWATLKLNSKNVPYVVYADGSDNFKANVAKFNGTNWVSVGESGFSKRDAASPSLAIDSNDVPYVVFSDGEQNGRGTVMKFDGLNWVNVGHPGFTAGIAIYPSLAIDSNNIPYVAYSCYSGDEIYVMKFNDGSWQNVGNLQVIGRTPSIAFDSSNIPYVAYADAENNEKATVIKFDGSGWKKVGDSGFSDGVTYFTNIAIDSNDVLYVAYQDWENDYKGTIMKFSGIEWINVGGSTVNATSFMSIAIDLKNIPYLAYMGMDGAIVSKFDGTNWINVGTPGFSAGYRPTISIDFDSNNIPFVAYSDINNNQKVTVKKYAPVNAEITVTYPNGGEVFRIGSKFTATWRSSGMLSSELLNIGLIQDRTNLIYPLATKTQNDGEETLIIPSNLKGAKYRLYIKTSNGSVSDLSDDTFIIY